MRKNRLSKEGIRSKKCEHKFRFGPAVYSSHEIWSIPVMIKEKDKEDGYTRVFLEAFVVEDSKGPLL